MAYQIFGNVYKVTPVENIQTKNGNTIQRCSLVLEQKRFDSTTGEEYAPSYPILEFSGNAISKLNGIQPGQKVKVNFEISGFKYNDKQTGEERFMSTLRGFNVEPYQVQQQQQPIQQPVQQPQQQAPQGYQPLGF